jgi:hypothetical protein
VDATHVTLAVGQSETCTITNTAQAPHLTLVKSVVNTFGTPAAATNWTLSAAGPTPISGAGGVSSDVNAGTYTLSETGSLAGYTNGTGYVCTGTGTGVDATHVTLAVGQSETCTITNTAQAPMLALTKIVSAGSTLFTPISNMNWTLTATGPATYAAAGGFASTAVQDGTYTLSENGPIAGYANGTTWTCSGTGSQTGNQVTVHLNQSMSCSITNSAIPPTITVNKVLVPNKAAGNNDTFNLQIDGNTAGTGSAVGDGGTTGAVMTTYGNHSVGETAASGSLTNYITTYSGACNGSPTVSVTALATNYTCIITNTKYGSAQVIKTINGASYTSSTTYPIFEFQIRQGADATTNAGTILTAGDLFTANSTNGGTLNFTNKLIPGNVYQMCEVVQPGWFTTLGPPLYAVFDPGGTNPSVVCTNFTAQAGVTTTFSLDNTFPSANGLASTIGYWKNWASCTSSSTNKAPVLDQTLYKSTFKLPANAWPFSQGISIGTLLLKDASTDTANKSSACQAADDLLNKSTIAAKSQKMASDPAFNLAAQLLGAILNVDAGAGIAANDLVALKEADALLAIHSFNGLTYTAFNAQEAALANTLATILDKYNNNQPDASSVPPLITSANSTSISLSLLSTFTVTATGSPAPTLSWSGPPTTGVTFNTTMGTLAVAAGTHTGTYTITFTATSSAGTFMQTFTLKVTT